jgi:hypothetical protein
VTKKSNNYIIAPRFHFCVLGHPKYFCDILKGERSGYDDGFFHRMITLCASVPMIKSAAIKAANLIPQQVTLIIVFLILKISHDQERHYTFSDDGLALLEAEFDNNKDYGVAANRGGDSFLRYLFTFSNQIFNFVYFNLKNCL